MKRYSMLDTIRGFILINMIAYHTLWDIVYIFGGDLQWYQSKAAYYWQQGICWGFILLSGFCWSFGKRKWKRGLIVFMSGWLITIVTAIFMPKSLIIFGVLTLLGTCMLWMIPIDKCLSRCNPVLGIGISFLLFLVTRNVNIGRLGIGEWKIVSLPRELYANWFTTYLGFPMRGFDSSDYFSVFPWVFLFVTGYYLHKVIEQKKLMDACNYMKCEVLEWLGRHSLAIYLLHQPIVYGVLLIII